MAGEDCLEPRDRGEDFFVSLTTGFDTPGKPVVDDLVTTFPRKTPEDPRPVAGEDRKVVGDGFRAGDGTRRERGDCAVGPVKNGLTREGILACRNGLTAPWRQERDAA